MDIKTKDQDLSLLQKNWQLKESDERMVSTIVQKFDLPEIIARVISHRDIEIDEVEGYLNPTIKQFLPDPFHLKEMDLAASRAVKAILENEKITIFGDYDVDGATSSSLLKVFFRKIGIDSDIYIPDRMEEGYGPTIFAFDKIKQTGTKVVITVDCGIVAYEPLKYAKEIGLDVIVIDHHLSAETMPEAVAVVNPNRLDENTEHGYLAAVGVSFLYAVAIRSELRNQNFFEDKQEPNLLDLLDLVALGTICDSVPLKPLNRAFVTQGLKLIEKRQNPGIAALADVSGVNGRPVCHHLGFVIGPRINAGGRVGKANLGSRVLSSESYEEAKTLSMQLEAHNQERRDIETGVLEEAKEMASKINENSRTIMIASNKWHPGVVGIVASRLKDIYNKPVAVLSIDENNIGKASCRSIRHIDFGSAIVEGKSLGILLDGGGHAMAAGFSLDMNKFDEACTFFENKFAQNFDKIKDRHCKMFDAYLETKAVNLELAQFLEKTAPYGIGNSEPRFVLKDVIVIKAFVIGSDHIRCIVKSRKSVHHTLRTTAFKVAQTEIGEILLHAPIKKEALDLFGKITINRWQGNENIEFIIEDIKLA